MVKFKGIQYADGHAKAGLQNANIHGASGGTRTPGPLITNQLLYQLSYAGLTT